MLYDGAKKFLEKNHIVMQAACNGGMTVRHLFQEHLRFERRRERSIEEPE